MWNWLKDNGTALIALTAILTVILTSTNSIHQRLDVQDRYIEQRFDAQDKYINQRFDAQDQRLHQLTGEVSEIRKLSDRLSRAEERIDAIREQIQTVDAPTP